MIYDRTRLVSPAFVAAHAAALARRARRDVWAHLVGAGAVLAIVWRLL